MLEQLTDYWKTIRDILFSSAAQNIFFNIIGGLLTVPLAIVFAAAWKKLRHFGFKRVFGPGAKSFVLTYGSLSFNEEVVQGVNRFPLRKESLPGLAYSAKRVSNDCELRAAAYLATALATDGGRDAVLRADEDIKDKLDLDFISLGAMNNLKTVDLLNNESNTFAEVDQTTLAFVKKESRERLYQPRPGHEYGIIIRIHPSQFSNRMWICCAGQGEWGTSGSAWYLSHKWRELRRQLARDEQFLAVVRVKSGQDESATLVSFDRSQTD